MVASNKCYAVHAIPCTCQICSAVGRMTTYNKHLRHVVCHLDYGHPSGHRFDVDGKVVTRATDNVLIGRVRHPKYQAHMVEAWRGYGVVIPSGTTTNGVIVDASRWIADRLPQGWTWDGPDLGDASEESIIRTLRTAYYEAFPEERREVHDAEA